MEIDEIEKKLSDVKDVILKVEELISDIKVCSSDTSKTILLAAIKKYASVIAEFKI